MNYETGELKRRDFIVGAGNVLAGDIIGSRMIQVNQPNSNCQRCKGKGSIPLSAGTRPERRRAIKRGLPKDANYMPCPECNP